MERSGYAKLLRTQERIDQEQFKSKYLSLYMEPTEQPKSNEVDIPQKIFSQLILELSNTTIPKSVTDQLKKTIVDKGDFSEQSLRAALTPNPEL